MAIAWPVNLGALGNSLAIWLGISPWQLFFYVFLPPLLLDAAVRIDWYLFKKVRTAAGGFTCCSAPATSKWDGRLPSCPHLRLADCRCAESGLQVFILIKAQESAETS
jgi:hypothetical protein